MMHSKKFISGLMICIGIGIVVFFYYRGDRAGEVIPTEEVRRGNVSETVSVTGEYLPLEYADVAFLSTGIVDAVYVAEGQSIEKGQKIASLDREVLWSQLKSARLALRVAEGKETLARRHWDTLKPEEKSAEKLATEQAREAVRLLETRMEEQTVFAPLNGQVAHLDVRVGEVVTPSYNVAHIVHPEVFVIETRIPESDVAKIALDMSALVTFDAFRTDEVFQATVTEIEPKATVVQGVVSYIVKLRLTTTDVRLREGMTANVDIETAKRERVLTLPFRALTKEKSKTYAEVRQSDGSFVKKEVIVGLEGDEGTVEILSGLQEGDLVTIGTTQKK
ncbi:MAG: efflux RND transporter periplasmic adaptor subunit [Minisyncoccota bacterium]